jgi:hypothetical protein
MARERLCLWFGIGKYQKCSKGLLVGSNVYNVYLGYIYFIKNRKIYLYIYKKPPHLTINLKIVT